MGEAKEKKPVEILRAKRGKVPEELLARVRESNKIKAAIRKALADGPKTPPQIAEAAGYPVREIFWYLMSMRKYGQVHEEGEEAGYRLYALAEEKKEK